MNEEVKKELDKLTGCTIVGSCYRKGGVFDTLSLQLKKEGEVFRFDVIFRYIFALKTEKVTKRGEN